MRGRTRFAELANPQPENRAKQAVKCDRPVSPGAPSATPGEQARGSENQKKKTRGDDSEQQAEPTHRALSASTPPSSLMRVPCASRARSPACHRVADNSPSARRP